MEIHEILNPSFGDMNIEQQIEAGINDWVARDREGREFFGRSREEAQRARIEWAQRHGNDSGFDPYAGL